MSARTRITAALAAALVAALAAWSALATSSALPTVVAAMSPQAPAQQPPPPPQPGGNVAITVTVVAGEDGVPVKGARVTLTAVPASTVPAGPGQMAAPPPPARDGGRTVVVRQQARTGAGGVASFSGLPDGEYTVSAEPPAGFVSRDAGPRVQVASGGHATATVKLDRGAVITGRVLDEDGDPVTGAFVRVSRVSRSGARSQGSSGSTQPTNDLGVYRVWSLPAGDYVVMAQFDDRQGPSAQPGFVDGYLPTYYPGVAAFSAATAVEAKAGQETGPVDIALVRGRLGTVTGRVTDSAGRPVAPGVPGASVTLTPRGQGLALSTRGGGVRQDGTFLIPGIPAGDYYLSAVVGRIDRDSPGEAAFVPITVNGDDVSVSIQTNAGATISGRVVVQGTPPPQSGAPGSTGRLAPTRVTARVGVEGESYSPAFSTGGSSPGPVAVRADGTFTLTGLRGPIQIAATGGPAALQAVKRGAQDISGQPIELLGTERIDDVVVVMTYDTGGIQGTVEVDFEVRPSGVAVFVVPDDRDTWHVGSPFVRSARVTAGGTPGAGAAAATPGVRTAPGKAGEGQTAFELAALPSGRYLVVAVANGRALSTPDRQVIERWRESGAVVSVDAGQTATVKVRAIK
jgi:hypothetical protein